MPITPSVPQRLLARIQLAIPKNPQLQELFRDITTYIEESSAVLQLQPNGQQPASKKRKLDGAEDGAIEDADSISDISFTIPQRKKLKLSLGRTSIRGSNPISNETEFGLAWSKVEHCVCLPVPEKAQPQYNFCFFPREGSDDEQILFTVPGGNVKGAAIHSDVSFDPHESYKDVVIRIINKRLKKKVLEPNEKEFVSKVAQAHRKGEKAVHVKAFRGSKDGFLFFLSNGIVWGFKKPLEFFPFHAITSISYTSVLQRTFNLNIAIQNADDEAKEIEFSMIDQADFAGIDAYVKRHDLQDASMAEQRRAKKINVNGVKKKEDGVEGDGEEDGEGELQKAAREAEEMDDEDEEEDENFDPGSEGESEGSGSSSEEEGDDQRMGQDGRDLVDEELGSEREEVSE
ncbi:MAG: hypothetical protein LQ338_002709 [Usnochroma carphineum]|nr:MAG: hypothetical protein LQ338_002709 [Usnochroma carphineum]